MLSPDALPDALRERTRVLGSGATMDGGFVMYWVRGALRARENPALDAALWVAHTLDLPVFVHQALSERYPFASDRHHTFLLEGARDLAAQLAERRIGYALHVERDGHRPGPVTKVLADRAALVVLEDLPTHPLRDWAEHLARDVSTPVWSVDTACVVPMTRVDRVYTRAFRFRQAIEEDLEARIRLPWSEQPDPDAPFVPDALPYEPVDLEATPIDELVAACAIDHSVGPVSDTRGGSEAGYARWRDFVRSGGLKRYARTRNDAVKDGVSRMSAYLHHGMVAPTRLAREAVDHGGKGAEKYLDELIVWRELAWNFCRKKADHDTLRALPGWAVRTLQAHADDPREALFDLETLSRARTGDALWDACQRSLLVHGELHNNVRMTWGKALLGWTPGPTTALQALIDLNHGYALDGRDPNSFGGLLWCMGGFDRPFTPERPVLGTVRGRPLDGHARRLDVDAYADKVDRPLYPSRPRVAVVGAGPAGAMAARTLRDHGLDVIAFDKGRGAGGRLSTRRADARRFDHGSSCFGAVPDSLVRYVRAWRERGLLSDWEAPFIDVSGRAAMPPEPGDRLVATPSMSALVKHLVEDVDVRFGARVCRLDTDGERIAVHLEDGSIEVVDHALVAVPAPQAVPIVQPVAPELVPALERVVYDPAWVVMLGFPVSTGRRWGMSLLQHDPVIKRIIRNQTKPGRPPGEQWVVECTAAFSTAHLEAERDAIIDRVLPHLHDLLDLPEPDHVAAHRWRFSRVTTAVGRPCLLTDDGRVGLCGDSIAGDGVGNAIASGTALAGRLLGWLHHRSRPSPEQLDLLEVL